jgi:pimeloyl-ACP methyl ester carboxylesterase
MPSLERPDGVRLAWAERGEGPVVVLANQFFGVAETFAPLLEDLAGDHRVITYNLRGTADSTRQGPFTPEVDAADLEAIVELAGEPVVLLAFADGCNRAVRVAARRPELVRAVVSPAGNPVGLAAVEGTDALAASSGVLQGLMGMMSTDYRGALRTMFATANPGWDDESVRQRVAATVEILPQEAALPRLEAWIADNVIEESRRIGDRLWMLEDGSNPWFPIEVARQTGRILPDAHILEVEDGAISRPDITAGVIRRLTSGETKNGPRPGHGPSSRSHSETY